MKLFCVNEEHFDLSILQSLIESGICSLIDISMPAVRAAGEAHMSGGHAQYQSRLPQHTASPRGYPQQQRACPQCKGIRGL